MGKNFNLEKQLGLTFCLYETKRCVLYKNDIDYEI